MEKHKVRVSIDYAKCAPCSGLVCVGVCPQGILEAGSDNKPRIAEVVSCTQCGVCADLCSSKAIIVTHEEEKR